MFLNAYDNLNILPQTVKLAKGNCVCGPVSTVPSSLNFILCSCPDYGFPQLYKEIHEILCCYLEQQYLNKFSCLNPSYTKVFVTHTLYKGGLARTSYYHINPKVQELNILQDIRDILGGGGGGGGGVTAKF